MSIIVPDRGRALGWSSQQTRRVWSAARQRALVAAVIMMEETCDRWPGRSSAEISLQHAQRALQAYRERPSLVDGEFPAN